MSQSDYSQPACQIWRRTDKSLCAFILKCVSLDKYDVVDGYNTTFEVFEALRTHHEKLGLYVQINLFRKAFDISYNPNTPMNTTSREIQSIYDRIVKMGAFGNDKLLTVLLVNTLAKHYSQLQLTVHGMTDDPGYTSANEFKQVDTEASIWKTLHGQICLNELEVAEKHEQYRKKWYFAHNWLTRNSIVSCCSIFCIF